MNLIEEALSLAHPLFRFGHPHVQQPKRIPIPTSAHYIEFDVMRVGPRYTMHRIIPSTEEKVVGRDDDFVSEFTLPKELRTTNGHYSNYNKAHPEHPMDKGHQTGSQVRRTDRLAQHDVDSLAGVCPEGAKLNRNVKGPLESRIAERAKDFIDVRCCQGPGWFDWSPDYEPPLGKLESGQWVPDFLWISSFWRTASGFETFSWTMQNKPLIEDVQLTSISLDELERQTLLHVWGKAQGIKRDAVNPDEWWA